MGFLKIVSEETKNKRRKAAILRSQGLPVHTDYDSYESHRDIWVCHSKESKKRVLNHKNPCHPRCGSCKRTKHGMTYTPEYVNALVFFRKNKINLEVIDEEFFYLSVFLHFASRMLNNPKGDSRMNAKTLMAEIKSNALKQIAESLNEVLEKVKSEETDIKQAMVQITAHKHLIQTIALDWTFNGVDKNARKLLGQ